MKLPSFFRRSKSDYFEGAAASVDSQPHPHRKKRREELREELYLDSTYDRRKRKLNQTQLFSYYVPILEKEGTANGQKSANEINFFGKISYPTLNLIPIVSSTSPGSWRKRNKQATFVVKIVSIWSLESPYMYFEARQKCSTEIGILFWIMHLDISFKAGKHQDSGSLTSTI